MPAQTNLVRSLLLITHTPTLPLNPVYVRSHHEFVLPNKRLTTLSLGKLSAC
jgi:hypothetical protein